MATWSWLDAHRDGPADDVRPVAWVDRPDRPLTEHEVRWEKGTLAFEAQQQGDGPRSDGPDGWGA